VISEALYVRVPRAEISMLRYVLEASDGLALPTTIGVDEAGREVVQLRFAPGARASLLRALAAAAPLCTAEILS